MARRFRFLITAGPTVEPIDAVRFLSNRSSGRIGYAIAAAARRRGHHVTLISGPVSLAPPLGVRLIRVRTTHEMLMACRRAFRRTDVLVMAAAVADYRPARPARAKRSKKGPRLSLPLVRNPDILATLCRAKGKRLVVGFALENALSPGTALAKLRRKRCDAIVLNALGSLGGEAFRGWLLSVGKRSLPLGLTKVRAAGRLVAWIEQARSGPRRTKTR